VVYPSEDSTINGFWYIGSPYSKYPAGLDAAFDAVVMARGRLVLAGIPCFSPIIHAHPVAKACGIDPYDHAIWLPAERPMLDASSGLIVAMLEGWPESFGLNQEIGIFKSEGKPIVYWDPELPPPVDQLKDTIHVTY
jgi:hypothetical protein